MDSTIKYLVGGLFLMFLLHPEPACYYPDEQPQLREATLEDIEFVMNDLSTQPLWLHQSGQSMDPTIKDGQVCLCEFEPEYGVRDIISFYWLFDNSKVQFITHRISNITDEVIFTKGDNNPTQDRYTITEDEIFCKIKEEPKLFKLLGDI